MSLGFGGVGLAAAAGVARFGFFGEGSIAQRLNSNLADTAGFIFLPFAGIAISSGSREAFEDTAHRVLLALVIIHALARAIGGTAQEILKVILNAGAFIVPLLLLAYQQADTWLLAATGLYLFGGVVVGPDRHRRILGVRREDIFHYILGTASAAIAFRVRTLSVHPLP